jgi:hypothetical protein
MKRVLLATAAVLAATVAQASEGLPEQFAGRWCLTRGADHGRADPYVRGNCVYVKNGETKVRGVDMKNQNTDVMAMDIRPNSIDRIQADDHEPASRSHCRILSAVPNKEQNWLVRIRCNEDPSYPQAEEHLYWMTLTGKTLYSRWRSTVRHENR